MNRSDAVVEVQEALGFRTDLEDEIVRRMVRVVALLEMGTTLPWFLKQEAQTLSVVAGVDPALPSGFIREVEYTKGGLRYQPDVDEGFVWLRKMDYDKALSQYATADDADWPAAYTLMKSTIRFWPYTEENVTLIWDYYKHSVSLEGAGDVTTNEWLIYAPYLVIGNTLASIAKTLRNPGAAAEGSEIATIAYNNLLRENAAREIANRQYILGRDS